MISFDFTQFKSTDGIFLSIKKNTKKTSRRIAVFPTGHSSSSTHNVGKHLLIARSVLITLLFPRDTRLCLHGYVADAQSRHCRVELVLPAEGEEPERSDGSSISFSPKRQNQSKMVRRARLRQDSVIGRWRLNRQWWNLCSTVLPLQSRCCLFFTIFL